MNFDKFTDGDLLDYYYKRRDIFPQKAKTAFMKLYEKYSSTAITLAFQYSNNSDDAYSMFNDAFLMIMDRRIEFENPNLFFSYLTKVMRNRAFNNVRKRRKVEESLLEHYHDKKLIKRPEVEKQDLNDLIEDLDLSEVNKKIIRLRIEGYGNKEISNKLNLSINSIYKRLSQIKDKIEIE